MKPTKRFVQNDDAITYNQRMSLNGMAQLNVNENGLSEKDSFDSNKTFPISCTIHSLD